MGCENPILPNIAAQVVSHGTLLVNIDPCSAFINSISGKFLPGILPKTSNRSPVTVERTLPKRAITVWAYDLLKDSADNF
jgi:hypothetical protein